MDISEFAEIGGYSAEQGRSIGKGESLSDNLYELEGLSPAEYLYEINPGLYGKLETTERHVIMHKNSEEPIRRFAVKKVEIKRKNDGIVIEDKAVINRLVSVRKGEKGRRLDPDDIVDINGYFHFDLPCKLVWECRIESDTEGIVHLICYHAKENGWYDYDVTSILTDHFR